MKRPADLAPWLPTWAWILVGALQLLGGVGFAGLTGSGPWCERQGWDRIMAAVSVGAGSGPEAAHDGFSYRVAVMGPKSSCHRGDAW